MRLQSSERGQGPERLTAVYVRKVGGPSLRTTEREASSANGTHSRATRCDLVKLREVGLCCMQAARKLQEKSLALGSVRGEASGFMQGEGMLLHTSEKSLSRNRKPVGR